MARKKQYKFALKFKGEIVAESDWSSILFAQKNKRPEKSGNYEVINQVTGKVAGVKA